jgi:hypothetical protein
MDAVTPVEETIEALEDVVRQGKVRYIGFSNWPAWMAAKAVGIQRARGWSQFRQPAGGRRQGLRGARPPFDGAPRAVIVMP